MQEQTLILIKPDAYRRRLTGEILRRFEAAGLAISSIRVSVDEQNLTESHYPRDASWLATVGGKTLEDYRSMGLSTSQSLGTEDPVEIGKIIRGRLVSFLQSGPIIPAVMSGNRAIHNVRKLVGATLPVFAAPGTIRGDLSSDSTDLANTEERPVENLIHASGDPAEAEREIALWFPAN
jgi:nucleoside-diphosphate kinase